MKNLKFLLILGAICISLTLSQSQTNPVGSDINPKFSVNNSYISNEDLDADGYTINNKPQGSTSAVPLDNKKENQVNPEAQVILPIRRRDTSQAVLNQGPCGGVKKRKADTLTNKGSPLQVMWEVITPMAGGNCTVKLSPGLENESNFTALRPLNLPIYNKEYSFPCGRVKGFESQQFELPEDYVCDQCTLQWTWRTSFGNLYSCSDIIINGNKINDCLARCKNGGACFNGKCLCTEDYYGDFCQYNKNESSSVAWIVLLLLLLAVAGGAVYYFFFINKNVRETIFIQLNF
jgi:hypothetical protein